MQIFSLKDHEDSWLPEGKNWKLVWNDEFDGTELDMTKWDYRMSMMGKNHPAWSRNGVKLDGKSNAVFELTMEDGRPVSSQLQTGYNYMDEPIVATKFGQDALQWNIGKLHENKFLHTFGYYECRCRLQQKPGWWSAFWIQSPIIGASLDSEQSGTEIDILESFRPGYVSGHYIHTHGYGLDHKHQAVGKNHEDISTTEFHRFGVLWDETGYTFYIDGVEDGHAEKYVSRCPSFILISTEVTGYRHETHTPVKEAFDNIGDTFLVDHVRVFDAI